MVLEHLFPADWLEKKSRYAFVLGLVYSIVGIALARVLFRSDPALVAVAFTSLMLLPELNKLFSIEEREEGREKRFSIKELFNDNGPFIKVYVFLFLGILIAYSLASIYLPEFELNHLFREQLEFRMDAPSGGATYTGALFADLLKNNLVVLVVCFLLALFTGDGAIFVITWNASLWGAIFGFTARNAATVTNASPIVYFLIIMLIVLPHVLLEALAYITAAISGGVISKDVILEKFDSVRFNMVFVYNFILFLVAIGFLLVGCFVETLVLENSAKYAEIVALSYS